MSIGFGGSFESINKYHRGVIFSAGGVFDLVWVYCYFVWSTVVLHVFMRAGLMW